MKLDAFSISLNVKDLEVSKAFYQKLGFDVFAGDVGQNYLILKNGNALIGLFQAMFEQNILTFIRVGMKEPTSLNRSTMCEAFRKI
ncbi:hypothetical protein [Sunxiuqinia sp. sy24]|uniref:hypothetical protein n=1 Tax=Sunxiuqinia sp. sy24 TaxID=3461495 RepID=UPI004045C1BE